MSSQLLSKEEILDDCYDKHPYDLDEPVCTKKAALAAMDEFGKQDAIGFATFVDEMGFVKRSSDDIWVSVRYFLERNDGDLYTLYQQSKQPKT